MTSYAAEWLLAFALTQLVEVPIYVRALPAPGRLWKAFLPSAITHPVIWFVIGPRWTGSYLSMVAVSEAFAVGTELAVLAVLRARRPVLFALVANAASFLVGIALYALRASW